MHQPQFGKAPSGDRLERIKKSPNYKGGSFQNQSHTPALSEGVGYFKVMKEFFFQKDKRNIPATVLPSQRVELGDIPVDKDVLVWFGHSSYFMQVAGKKILVDPVFSGNASPVSFTTRSFKGSDVYSAADMPELDYLLITHDHYDHLDYKTVKELRPKVKKAVMGLGVGSHFEHWGYDTSSITELDWHEELVLDEALRLNTTPARHFSGRGLTRNNTLWLSYVLTSPEKRIFIGGDSGYDSHFSAIGREFGPFDLALLENGQYDKNWKYIHMMPEEVVQAATDLDAKLLFPVHWSKFALGAHAWDEPILRVVKAAANKGVPLMHPMIGELVVLGENSQAQNWWDGLG